MTTKTSVTTKMYRIFIKASPEAIWEAITSPEWTEKYGYRGRGEYELRPGGTYRCHATPQMLEFGTPEVIVEGEVVEVDPPWRLVQTYRFNFSPEMIEEGFTTLTFEIEAEHGGLCRLTVTHDVEDAPIMASQIDGDGPLSEGGGGWPWILSDLKTLLETGEAFEG